MRYILLAISLVFTLGAADEMLLEGKRIYQETCISCHGVDGNTNPEMNLIIRPRKLSLSILTEAQIYEIAKGGTYRWGSHADIMPSFERVYDDRQIHAVAKYVKQTLNKGGDLRVQKLLDASKPIPPEKEAKMLKRGKKIFLRNCALCHGVNGNGHSEYVEKSKASDLFIFPYDLRKIILSEEQIFLYAKFGGKAWGTAEDHMPSWKKKYDDYTLRSVAKYVQEEIKHHKDDD